MRFHHSTRRGRNRLGQQGQHPSAGHHSGGYHRSASSFSGSRWSQLGYCRETNIHFNRRLPIEPPPSAMSPVQLDLEANNGHQLFVMGNKESRNQRRYIALHNSQELAQAPGWNQADKQPDDDDGDTREEEPEEATGEAAARTLAQPSAATIDLELARQRLIGQVDKHRFWSNKAAKRMQLIGSERRLVYIYELVSFCERRDLEWRYEPYRGAGSLSPGASAIVPFRRLELVPEPSTVSPTNSANNYRPNLNQFSSTQHSIGAFNQFQQPTSEPKPRPDSFWPAAPIRSATDGLQVTGSNQGQKGAPSARYEPIGALAERHEPSPETIWSVEAPASVRPRAFCGQLHSTELANSSFVKRCHGCQGRGRLKCNSCHGVGYEVCLSCSGKGTTRNGHSSALGARYSGSSGRDYASARNSPHASGYSEAADAGSFYSPSSGDSGRRSARDQPGGISQSSGGATSWHTESCHFCHGAGQKRCWVCAGKAYIHCLGCLGAGQLRCYLQLNITWINHRDEIVINDADQIIPRDRLRLSSGLQLAEQTDDRLAPLKLASNCAKVERVADCTAERDRSRAPTSGINSKTPPDAALANYNCVSPEEAQQIEVASKRLLERHKQVHLRQERLLRQRQKVTQIECHKVSYEWKQRRGHFVIYGDERKVYIAKYPFKSFCNIS